MGFYKLEILNSANKDIRKIDRLHIKNIFKAIKSLEENPLPLRCKKLKGSESSYRIRVGNYRVIYEIDASEKKVTIFHIRHRQDAYKKKMISK